MESFRATTYIYKEEEVTLVVRIPNNRMEIRRNNTSVIISKEQVMEFFDLIEKPIVRKFVHKLGFLSNTVDHVEIDGDQVWCVSKSGNRSKAFCTTPQDVHNYVRQGRWKEIT